MIKIKFENNIDYEYLLACLDRYLEKLTEAEDIKSVAKLIETILENEEEE